MNVEIPVAIVAIGLAVYMIHSIIRNLLVSPQITLTDPDISDVKKAEEDTGGDVFELHCPQCNNTHVRMADSNPFYGKYEDRIEKQMGKEFIYHYTCAKCGNWFSSKKRVVRPPIEDGPVHQGDDEFTVDDWNE